MVWFGLCGIGLIYYFMYVMEYGLLDEFVCLLVVLMFVVVVLLVVVYGVFVLFVLGFL